MSWALAAAPYRRSACAGSRAARRFVWPRPGFAAGDVRTLTFFHTHSEETATVTFRRNGRYDEQGLNQLNWLLRDWRSDETTRMDPRLFDILWELQRELGSASPIHVISAYRSPATNGALRRRSGAVAENSLHMAGKAIDVRLPDVDTAKLRAIAMKAQFGGVGAYPAAEFVHVDTGSVRAWPRMTQEQLAQLFPTGKTVHLPSNGQPLARHDEARAEIAAREAKLASAGVRAGSAVHGRGIAMASLTCPTRFSSEPSPMAGRSLRQGVRNPTLLRSRPSESRQLRSRPFPASPKVAAEFDEVQSCGPCSHRLPRSRTSGLRRSCKWRSSADRTRSPPPPSPRPRRWPSASIMLPVVD